MARRKATATGSAALVGNLAQTSTYASASPPMSRADYVESVIRQDVVGGQLPPGTPLIQDEIAARLGVSITPVREALRRLESVGLVSYETHFGATVAELKNHDIEELYLLRAVVEGLAARLAVSVITEDELEVLQEIHRKCLLAAEDQDVAAMAEGSRMFHRAIATAGGRTIVARHLEQIWEMHPVPLDQSVWAMPDVSRHALEFHSRIHEALARRDATAAERLMGEHIYMAIHNA